MGEVANCRHSWRLIRADYHRRRIQRWCTACKITRWVSAPKCETCDERRKADHARWLADQTLPPLGFKMGGCGTCFDGLVPQRWRPPCCCGGPVSERCANCAAAAGPLATHVCLTETAEEFEDQVMLMTMPKPATYRSPMADEAAALDQSAGIRVSEKGR